MAQTGVLSRDRTPGPDPDSETSKVVTISGALVHTRGISPFWRHYLEMFAVMVVGMVASGYILARIVGLTSWDTLMRYRRSDYSMQM
jgi:hypothetical protein